MPSTSANLNALHATIKGLDAGGDFAAGGTLPLPLSPLDVDGVGLFAAPIGTAVAAALRAASTPAPYGRGPDTLVDATVRSCGQFDAAAVHLDHPGWAQLLASVTQAAATSLGIGGNVTARLYKLLIYGEGDFFLPHRDTEKEPGMFGTLVLTLPSRYQGGALRVTHLGREKTFGGSCDDLTALEWAAFYADCKHELLPLTSGERVALVFNLCRKGKLPRAPDRRSTIDSVCAALTELAATKDAPTKILLPLEHLYSAAELTYDACKGRDQAVGQTLRAAAERCDWHLGLGMVTVVESGSAESTYDHYRSSRRRRWGHSNRYRGYDDDDGDSGDGGDGGDGDGDGSSNADYEVIDVDERSEAIEGIMWVVGRSFPLGKLAFRADEVVPAGALDDVPFDKHAYHESSGNEGASFERSYRRAVWLLWPRRGDATVAEGADPASVRATLSAWRREPSRAADVQALAKAVVAGLRSADVHWQVLGHPSPFATLVDTLREGGLRSDLWALWRHHVAHIDLSNVGLALLWQTCLLDLWPSDAMALVQASEPANLPYRVERHAALARSLCGALPKRDAAALLDRLLTCLPEIEATTAWQRPKVQELQTLVVHLVCIADSLGEGHEGPVVAEISWRPQLFAINAVVIPAIETLRKLAWPTTARPALLGLTRTAEADLSSSHATPPQPPQDMVRSAGSQHCGCAECGQVKRFLADAQASRLEIRAVQAKRSHVEATVASCDVDCDTLKLSSPHRLRLTKNRASYDRALAAWRRDDARLVALRVALAEVEGRSD